MPAETLTDSLLRQTADLESLLNPKNELSAKIYDFSGRQGTRARQKLAEKIQSIEKAIGNIKESDPNKLLQLKNSLVDINWELQNIQNTVTEKNQQVKSFQQLSIKQQLKVCVKERSLRAFFQKQEAPLPSFSNETTLKNLYDKTVALRFESRELQDFLVEQKDDTEACERLKSHVGKWFAEKTGVPYVLEIKIKRESQIPLDSVRVEVVDAGFSYDGEIFESIEELRNKLQIKTHIREDSLSIIQNLASKDPSKVHELFTKTQAQSNQFLITKNSDANTFTLWNKEGKTIQPHSLTVDTLGRITIDDKTYKNFDEAKQALGLSETVTSLKKRQDMLRLKEVKIEPIQDLRLQARKDAAKSVMSENQEYYLITGDGSPIENSTTITVYTLKKTPTFYGENLSTSERQFSVTENGIGDCENWQEFKTKYLPNKKPFSDLETSYEQFRKDSAPYLKKSKDAAIGYLDQARHATQADQSAVAVYEENGKLHLAYSKSGNAPTVESLSIDNFSKRLNELKAASPESIDMNMGNKKKILTNIKALKNYFCPEAPEIVIANFSNYHKFLPNEAVTRFALFMDDGDVKICYYDNNKVHTQLIDLSTITADMEGPTLVDNLTSQFKGRHNYRDLHENYTAIIDMQSKLQSAILAVTSDHPGKIYRANDTDQARIDFTNAVTLLKKPEAYVLWETAQDGIYGALLLKDGKEHTCTIDLIKNPGKLSITIDGTEGIYENIEKFKALGFTTAAHTYRKDVATYNESSKALMSQIKIASMLNETATAQDAQKFARQAAAYHERSDVIHYVRMENPEPVGFWAKSLQYASSWLPSKPKSVTPTLYVLSLLVKQKDNSYELQEHKFSLNPSSSKMLLGGIEYDTFNDALTALTKGKSTISLANLDTNIAEIKRMEHLLQHQAAQLTDSKEEIETVLRNPAFVAVYASSRQESTVSVNSQNLPIEKTEYSLAYYDTTKKTIVQKKIDLYTTPGKVGVDGKFFDSLQGAINASCGNRRFLTDDDIRLQKPEPQQLPSLSTLVAETRYDLPGNTAKDRWARIKTKVSNFDVDNLQTNNARDLLLGILGYPAGVSWTAARKNSRDFNKRLESSKIEDPNFAALKTKAGLKS